MCLNGFVHECSTYASMSRLYVEFESEWEKTEHGKLRVESYKESTLWIRPAQETMIYPGYLYILFNWVQTFNAAPRPFGGSVQSAPTSAPTPFKPSYGKDDLAQRTSNLSISPGWVDLHENQHFHVLCIFLKIFHCQFGFEVFIVSKAVLNASFCVPYSNLSVSWAA